MDQVKLYSKNNILQRSDAIYALDNYLRLIKWKKTEKEKILDVGSGDGSVTLGLLLPRIPTDITKLVGCDISESMVDYANKQCVDPRIEFIQMDIQENEIPTGMKQEFDHIFSFYCLHWIQNQRSYTIQTAAVLDLKQIKLYTQNSSLQKTDAKYALDKYSYLIKWKNCGQEKILDIGSGDGSVTHELLLPYLPAKYKSVMGCDNSKLMVEYANKQMGHSGIKFKFLDIEEKTIPNDMYFEFDHVFSFYCMHWIQNQRQAFKNIYNLMAPGGDLLMIFLASNPIYNIYEVMGANQKWMTYMDNFKKYISPYHFSQTPIQDLEQILTEVGFSIHLCRLENRSFTFPNIQALEKATTAVNPFIKSIPNDMVNDYLKDFVDEVRKLNCVKIYTCDNNNESKLTFTYQLFVVFASKPEKK